MNNINVQTIPQSYNILISAKDQIYLFKCDPAAVLPPTPIDLTANAGAVPTAPAGLVAAFTTLGTSLNSIYVGFQIEDLFIANNNQVMKI